MSRWKPNGRAYASPARGDLAPSVKSSVSGDASATGVAAQSEVPQIADRPGRKGIHEHRRTTSAGGDPGSGRGQRHATRGRLRRIRHHRGPREGDDVPLALSARAARPPVVPDRRRGRERLDAPGAPPARARSDRGHRRADRRGGLRALRRAALLPQRRLRRSRDLRAAREGDRRRQPSRLLPGDPAVAVRHGDQGPVRGGPDRVGPGRGGEAVRPRPRFGSRAQRRGAPVHRRVAALPDRPLPREDGPGRGALPAVREHDVRADLEPQLRVVGADHDGGGLRRARTAGTSTTRSAPCATSS